MPGAPSSASCSPAERTAADDPGTATTAGFGVCAAGMPSAAGTRFCAKHVLANAQSDSVAHIRAIKLKNESVFGWGPRKFRVSIVRFASG